ncbi:MAG: GAF domain-containing protein [Actinobacteria bacterium]|nr:GAF domain-containing protein [Actinomycetota bacterium]
MALKPKGLITSYSTGLCKELESEIARILEDMAKHLNSDAAGFAMVNDDESIGYCALYNVVNYLGKLTVSKGIDVVGMVLATKKPIIIDDYPSFSKAVSAWVQIGTRSVASVSVLIEGRLAGAVTVLSINKKRHFSQDDIEEIERYAEKIIALLELAKRKTAGH